MKKTVLDFHRATIQLLGVAAEPEDAVALAEQLGIVFFDDHHDVATTLFRFCIDVGERMKGAGDGQQDQEGVFVGHGGDGDLIGDSDDRLVGENTQTIFEILGAEQGRAIAEKTMRW